MRITASHDKGHAVTRLLLILALLGVVLALLIVSARNYVEVDEVALPNLVGMNIDEASALLAQENITAAAYPEFIRAASIDEVTSQAPPAGTIVRRGRTVSLGVHTPPSEARAPVLIGLTAEEALAQARQQSLNLGQIEYAHNDAPAGIVISQSPEPGSAVDPEVGLQVTVSRGQELPPVAMPDVRGLMLDDAEQRLRQAGFISVSRVASGTTTNRPGSVVSQQPSAGAMVERSMPVYLSYSLAGDVVVQVPALRGQDAQTAQIRLRAERLAVAGIEYTDDPSVPTGTVVRTQPAAGSYMLANTPVRLVVNAAPGTVPEFSDEAPAAGIEPGPGSPDLFPSGELGGRSVPFEFDPAAQGIPSLMNQRYDLRIVV